MEQIICYCQNVSDLTILEAIKNGAKSVEDIGKMTGAGIGKECKTLNPTGKCCIPEIKTLLNDSSTQTKTCSCCCN